MANNQNNQKSAKKVATKAPKVHGAVKVPKYAQQEATSSLSLAPLKSTSAGKK
jgi:hypothetical protein